MLTLLLILVVTGVALGVFLYVGAMFLQGYIYTEPSGELYWQAPAAAGVLTLFLTVWCMLDATATGATPLDIPYDTIFRFSPRVDLLKEPAREIWVVKKDGEKRSFKREGQSQNRFRYVDTSYTPSRPWRMDGVVAVELDMDGEKNLFKYVPGTGGANGEYVNDQGWAMKEYGDGPDGTPSVFRWGRFLMNMFLNFGHFIVWWLCLWLLLRFQLGHALGLAFVMWLLVTFAVLPMLLGYAAQVAQSRTMAAGVVAFRFSTYSPKYA